MGVRQGYKQTEIGIIPNDWSVRALGAIAHIKTGSRNNQDKVEDGQYPFFVRSETVERIDSYSHDCEAILVPGEGGIGRIFHYINGRFDVHQRVYAITKFDPSMCGLYVHNYMRVHFGEHAMRNSVKATVDSLRLPTFKQFHLAAPSDFEQSAIAKALSDAEALVDSLEQLLAKKRQIKKGAVQELLTGKRRLPDFTDEWQTHSLGDIGEFLKGSGVSRSQSQSGSIPCVRYGELYTDHHEVIRRYLSFISSEVAQGATLIRNGDVLFAGSGETKAEIGKCAAFVDRDEAYAGGDIVILRPRSADASFLGYYLNTSAIARQKASKGQGDAVVHISASSLASIVVRLPAEKEQKAIAAVLSEMDAELAAIASKLEKTRQLKQGMMQELLTGRIRLV